MLKPKKKITKKEIKQDTLVTAYAKVTSFYYENKKKISYAITTFIVIIIAIVIYVNNKKANNEKAATELSKVFSIYDAGASDVKQYKVAIDGQPERGVLGLKAIVENYGSTEAGELAKFYLANAYYQLEQYDEALKYFKDFDASDDYLEASANAGIAGCYEVKRQYQEAAIYFEKAANLVANSINTPDYLYSAARCYGLAGEKEKAIILFKRLKKDFPTSTYARDVDRFIAQYST